MRPGSKAFFIFFIVGLLAYLTYSTSRDYPVLMDIPTSVFIPMVCSIVFFTLILFRVVFDD